MNRKRKNRASSRVFGAHLNTNLERPKKKVWFRKRLPNIARSLVYSAIITIGDLIVLLVLTRKMSGSILTLILFFEGGIGLLAGVAISLSSSPSMSKLGEQLFHTSPWSREAERHAESVGLKWMLTATFLVLLGFAISAI